MTSEYPRFQPYPLLLDVLVLENAKIDSKGNSDAYFNYGATHADVLIYVGSATGSPKVTFYLLVVEPSTGKVIRSYAGSEITAGDTADYITVHGLTLGTHLAVGWDGTLDASNYFEGVYVRLIAKA